MRQPVNNRPALKPRRRELRKTLTPAEARLWSCLQRYQLGAKFRRQQSIGPFIVDFYCPSARLAIELDGTAHDSDLAGRYDEARSAFLQKHGVRVMRFLNEDVIQNPEGVLRNIRMVLTGNDNASLHSWEASSPCQRRRD